MKLIKEVPAYILEIMKSVQLNANFDKKIQKTKLTINN